MKNQLVLLVYVIQLSYELAENEKCFGNISKALELIYYLNRPKNSFWA